MANSIGLHVGRVCAAAASIGADASELAATTYFVAAEAHYCIPKALRVLGVQACNVRRMPSQENGSIDIEALRADLDSLPHGAPAVLVATVGHTSSGDIDDLSGLAGELPPPEPA